jgi:hypothetical protein
MVIPLVGVRRVARMAVHDIRWSAPALVLIVVAIVLNRWWELRYGPTLALDPFPLDASMRAGLRQLPEVLRQQIGVFDYLEVEMPRIAYAIWTVLTCMLIIAGFTLGTDRERSLLTLAIVVTLALPVALVAIVMRHTGFPLQGRYVLAVSLIVPLLAGEIVVRHHDTLRDTAKRVLPLLIAAAALVQFVAWWTNARRFAVGRDGPPWFVNAAEWTPPWGWWPWIVLAASGAVLLLLTAVLRGEIRQSKFLDEGGLHRVMGGGKP